MRTIIHRGFPMWEFDKEERWLNEMAAKGLSLVSVGLWRYEFEDSLPGEYTVCIQLLEHRCSHPESRRYIEFLEETGVEQVGAFGRWVYFRKKKATGSFELFSDTPSRLRQLTRILQLLAVLGICNLYIGAYNLFLYFSWHIPSGLLGIVNLLLTAGCAAGLIRSICRRRELKKQLTLFE